MPAPVFRVHNQVGEHRPALHPDKAIALREILGKVKKQAAKKAKQTYTPQAQREAGQGVGSGPIFNLQDPTLKRYFNG